MNKNLTKELAGQPKTTFHALPIQEDNHPEITNVPQMNVDKIKLLCRVVKIKVCANNVLQGKQLTLIEEHVKILNVTGMNLEIQVEYVKDAKHFKE